MTAFNDPLARAKDAVLAFFGEADRFEDDADGEYDEGVLRGTMHYDLRVNSDLVRELLASVGIPLAFFETEREAIKSAINEAAAEDAARRVREAREEIKF